MKTPAGAFEQVRDQMGTQFNFRLDQEADKAVFILPFKDSMGDSFIIRVGEDNGHFVLDDSGMIQSILFTMDETVGGAKARKLTSALLADFGARLDKGEGVVELPSGYDEIVPRMLHFGKLLVTIDTMLVEIARQQREAARPDSQSLGPRAAHRIRKSLRPLIEARKVSQRVTVGGLTVPDWLVDFAYKPAVKRLAAEVEMVILISVDLAVLDPIDKSAYAYSRAMDIKAAHAAYDIRIAYDTHGQNSASASGARFLKEHQIDKAYSAIDLSEEHSLSELVRTVNQETGMALGV